MPRSPDFFRQLNEQLLEQLEEFARAPGRSVDECVEWLAKNSVKASRSAVGRWFQDFRLEDSTRRASAVARQYLEVMREADPAAVTEASLRKFDELVFDFLVNGDEVSAGDLMKIAQAMKSGLGSRRELSDLKQQQSEAVKAAEQAAKTGATGQDVVTTIKKALGIAAGASP